MVNKPEVLPDSRTRARSKGRLGAIQTAQGYMFPIYCASCGIEGGMIPEQNMNFAYWMCNDCFPKYGHLTVGMVMPDEIFWAKLAQEQMESYGRLLSAAEIVAVVEADASPLATLIKQGCA